MSQPNLPGPCEGYEFDLLGLLEGTLVAPRAADVRSHVQGCARCRAWLRDYTALDHALALALPRPALPADFGAKLMQRIEEATVPANRSALRATADLEFQQTVRELGRNVRSNVVAGAALVTCVATVAAAIAVALRPETVSLAHSLESAMGGYIGTNVMGAVGTATALFALGWSALQGLLPGVRLRR